MTMYFSCLLIVVTRKNEKTFLFYFSMYFKGNNYLNIIALIYYYDINFIILSIKWEGDYNNGILNKYYVLY